MAWSVLVPHRYLLVFCILSSSHSLLNHLLNFIISCVIPAYSGHIIHTIFSSALLLPKASNMYVTIDIRGPTSFYNCCRVLILATVLTLTTVLLVDAVLSFVLSANYNVAIPVVLDRCPRLDDRARLCKQSCTIAFGILTFSCTLGWKYVYYSPYQSSSINVSLTDYMTISFCDLVRIPVDDGGHPISSFSPAESTLLWLPFLPVRSEAEPSLNSACTEPDKRLQGSDATLSFSSARERQESSRSLDGSSTSHKLTIRRRSKSSSPPAKSSPQSSQPFEAKSSAKSSSPPAESSPQLSQPFAKSSSPPAESSPQSSQPFEVKSSAKSSSPPAEPSPQSSQPFEPKPSAKPSSISVVVKSTQGLQNSVADASAQEQQEQQPQSSQMLNVSVPSHQGDVARRSFFASPAESSLQSHQPPKTLSSAQSRVLSRRARRLHNRDADTSALTRRPSFASPAESSPQSLQPPKTLSSVESRVFSQPARRLHTIDADTSAQKQQHRQEQPCQYLRTDAIQAVETEESDEAHPAGSNGETQSAEEKSARRDSVEIACLATELLHLRIDEKTQQAAAGQEESIIPAQSILPSRTASPETPTEVAAAGGSGIDDECSNEEKVLKEVLSWEDCPLKEPTLRKRLVFKHGRDIPPADEMDEERMKMEYFAVKGKTMGSQPFTVYGGGRGADLLEHNLLKCWVLLNQHKFVGLWPKGYRPKYATLQGVWRGGAESSGTIKRFEDDDVSCVTDSTVTSQA